MKKHRKDCFNCKKEAISDHEICEACASNPFIAEKYRKYLAKYGKTRVYADTYSNEILNNFQNVNTAKSWDFLLKYHRYYEDRNIITKNRVKKIIRLIPSNKSTKVFDIGFGYGHVLLELARTGYTSLCGIDISTEAVDYIKNKLPNGLFFAGECTKLPLKDASVNVILANEVLEHLPCSATFRFYDEIKRICASDSSIILSVPLGENLETSTFMCPHGSLVNSNGHIREYPPQMLDLELKIAGLTPIERYSITPSKDVFSIMKNVFFRPTNATNYIVKAKIG